MIIMILLSLKPCSFIIIGFDRGAIKWQMMFFQANTNSFKSSKEKYFGKS